MGALGRTRTDSRSLHLSNLLEPTALFGEILAEVHADYRTWMQAGATRLREALSARYDLSPDRLLPTSGALSGAAVVLQTFLRPGDAVLVERPFYALLRDIAVQAGARVDFVSRSVSDGRIDPDEFAGQFRPETRVAIVTNPHNPGGHFLSDEDILSLAQIAERHDAILLVDEVYRDFDPARRRAGAARLAGTIVGINSMSKTLGLPGLRCGWIDADPLMIARLRVTQASTDFGISALGHALAAAVFARNDEFRAHAAALLEANRAVAIDWSNAMIERGLLANGVPPSGGLYFPRLPTEPDTRALAIRAWNSEHLLIAPGEYFGAAGHIRIGMAGDSGALAAGLERLRRLLEGRERTA